MPTEPHVAAALKLDMAQHWTPQAVFLSRLSKAQLAEVMTEAGCSGDAVKAIGLRPDSQWVIGAPWAFLQ